MGPAALQGPGSVGHVHLTFNADLPKWVELAGLLKLSRNVAVWQFFEDHGPPKQPHRPENVQKALQILEGVSLRRAPGLAAAASVLRNPPPGMLPAASAEAAKDTAASSSSADAGTATAASAEKKMEGEAAGAGSVLVHPQLHTSVSSVLRLTVDDVSIKLFGAFRRQDASTVQTQLRRSHGGAGT